VDEIAKPEVNPRFVEVVAVIPQLFHKLEVGIPFLEKGVAAQKGLAGVYAFFEDGHPVHVGRTRNLQARLRGHITRSHFSASFAFKRARRVLEMNATYKVEGSRAALTNHQTFGPEFSRQIVRVKRMEVRFVEISDPLAQYLLELYACLEWGLPLDEFDTY
jgi:hypothetical protein